MNERGKKASPLTQLQVLARVHGLKSSRNVAAEFGIDKSTINRWRTAFLRTPNLEDELRAARRSINQLLRLS